MAYKIQLLTICLLTSAVFPGNARQVKQDDSSDAQSAGPSKQPSYKVLYSFTGGTDGGDPNGVSTDAVLLRDREGNLYGTASYGGLINNNCPSGLSQDDRILYLGQRLNNTSGTAMGAFVKLVPAIRISSHDQWATTKAPTASAESYSAPMCVYGARSGKGL